MRPEKDEGSLLGTDGLKNPSGWADTDISGQTILVHWEQGFGDVIQFSRYIELLRDAGATVLFAPQKELRLLMRRLEGDPNIVDVDE